MNEHLDIRKSRSTNIGFSSFSITEDISLIKIITSVGSSYESYNINFLLSFMRRI